MLTESAYELNDRVREAFSERYPFFDIANGQRAYSYGTIYFHIVAFCDGMFVAEYTRATNGRPRVGFKSSHGSQLRLTVPL